MKKIQFKMRCNGDNRKDQGNFDIQEVSFASFDKEGKPLEPDKIYNGHLTIGLVGGSDSVIYGKRFIVTIEEDLNPTSDPEDSKSSVQPNIPMIHSGTSSTG